MTRHKKSGFLIVIVSLLFILTISASVYAIDTARIDVVRSKQILDDRDTGVIDNFVSQAFTAFLATRDFSRIAAVRGQIISRSVSGIPSGQIQYGPRFATAAGKQISRTAGEIKAMPVSVRRTMLSMNLLIIISELANIDIAKTALEFVDDNSPLVRYWAVNTFTNPALITQLGYDSSSSTEIARKLKSRIAKENSMEVMTKIAAFAAAVKYPEGVQILTVISEKRVAAYDSWLVKDEADDADILASLVDCIENDPQNKIPAGKNFALLYSAVIQRYALGGQVLSEKQKQGLKSVIVQTEKYLPKLLGAWPGTLKRAIEKNSMDSLMAEHDLLFGTSSVPGKLAEALGFDYGKTPEGTLKTAAPAMPKPPKKIK